MKRLLLLVAIVLMATNMAQAQDSTIVARAYKDSLYQVTVTINRAERKARRLFEDRQPWKTRFIVGANVIYEVGYGGPYSASHKAAFNPSVSFEVQLTRHSGIEVGVGYRNDVIKPNVSMHRYTSGNYRYISIPVLYKYYSRILNFAVGVNYDYRLSTTLPSTDEHNHCFGFLLKVTKDIKLYKGLIVEPYVQVNPVVYSNVWLGVGVGLKYRF